jgi:hypothetical protein
VKGRGRGSTLRGKRFALSRAAWAREIAMMLSRVDANVMETYAAECEAEAKRLTIEQRLLIAA